MAFDRYMIQVRAGAHPKLRELTPQERYVFFLGVLSLAAQANPRGSLHVGGRAVDWRDVASECSVRGQVATRAMAKLRQIGIIESSDDGNEYVHDFDDYNPKPRTDATNAERQRRYRQRRNGRYVTSRNAGEVEKLKEEGPLNPPARNGAAATDEQARWQALYARLPEFAPLSIRHAVHHFNTLGTTPTPEDIRRYLANEEPQQ